MASSTKRFAARASALLALVLLASAIPASSSARDPPPPEKVKVTLYVMSRCPDAQRVETGVFDGVMSRVRDIAEVQFSFIASAQGADVTCKHGPRECKGNVQQLCVQNYAGSGDDNYDALWQFVLCQDDRADEIGDAQLADDCIDAYVPDKYADDVRRCSDGWEGLGLLRGSVERSKGLSVTRSCTIFIEDKLRCIQDGGEWYQCDAGHEEQDFVDSICDAYLEKNDEWPDLCGDQEARKQRAHDKAAAALAAGGSADTHKMLRGGSTSAEGAAVA